MPDVEHQRKNQRTEVIAKAEVLCSDDVLGDEATASPPEHEPHIVTVWGSDCIGCHSGAAASDGLDLGPATAYANTVASIIFAGISGTAIADTAALGQVFIKGMPKEGYTKEELMAGLGTGPAAASPHSSPPPLPACPRRSGLRGPA